MCHSDYRDFRKGGIFMSEVLINRHDKFKGKSATLPSPQLERKTLINANYEKYFHSHDCML